jgi:hypothetical protein
MKEECAYVHMADEKTAPSNASFHVAPLDEAFDGRLNGLIRHDHTIVRGYEDSVEILDTLEFYHVRRGSI